MTNKDKFMNNPLTHKPKRILIIRLSSLGDITHCLPVTYNLRKYYPNAYVAWLVREKYKELLEMNTSLDEIIEIKNISPKGILARIKEMWRIIGIIRSREFDVILDLHCVLITNIISIFSNSLLKLGIDKKNELGIRLLKYQPLPKDKIIHRIDVYLSILNLLEIKDCEIRYPLQIPTENKDKALNLWKGYNYTLYNAVIAIHPGTMLKIKQWEAEKFTEVASILATKYGPEIIFIYDPTEEHPKQNQLTRLRNPKVKFVTCYNIKDLAATLERCDLLIGNDSGPIHLAAALGIPTISIFGPSNHLVSGPYGNKDKVIRKAVSCSPCYGTFSVKLNCKYKNQKCLRLLSVTDVLRETEPMIIRTIDAKHKKIKPDK